MTNMVLARTAKLGIAAEPVNSVYRAPSHTVTFQRGTTYRSVITQICDTTYRGSDTSLQDIQQGPCWSQWTLNTPGYADWAGWLLRAMIGPDTCTPGTVTVFAAPSAAGAVSVSLDAAPPPGSVLLLGTGTTAEYAQAGTPSGTGPYTVPVTAPAGGLTWPHAATEPAQSQARHVFEQDRPYNIAWPSYSLTTDDGIDQLGWPGCTLGKLHVQITDTGILNFATTWNGFPPVPAAAFTEDQSPVQAPAGWGWQIITAGGASTRGKALDLTLTRVLQVTPVCDGQQSPLGIFPGPMCASGKYAAVYDTPADLDLYRHATQEPAVHTFTQPALSGGASLEMTMSLSGWTQGAASLHDTYVTAAFEMSGITNTTDSAASGVSSAVLRNFWQSPYA